MLKHALAVSALTVLTGSIGLAQQADVLWSHTLGSPDTDYGVSSLAAPDGTVWVMGGVQGFGFGSKTIVRRYDRSGTLLTSEQFPLANYTTRKNEMVLDGLGGAYIGGWTRASSGSPMNMILARVDQVGSLLWTRIFDIPEWDRIQGLAPDGQGGVFVGGRVGQLGGPITGVEDAYVGRFNSQGDEVWSQTFGTSEFDTVEGCVSDGAGGLIAVGYTRGTMASPSIGSLSGFLIRFNANGQELWRRGVSSDDSDVVYKVTSDRRGGCYIAGVTSGNYASPLIGTNDLVLAHFDAAGQELWRTQIGEPGRATAPNSLAAHPGGGCLVVTGSSGSVVTPSLGSDDIRLLRVDDSGILREERGIGGPTTAEHATHASYDMDGELLLTGFTISSDLFGSQIGGLDIFVARVGADSIGETLCDSQVPNSVGRTAQLRVFGSSFVEDDLLDLRVQNLPMNSFGHFFTSTQAAAPTMPPNSAGSLCIGGAIGRFVGPGQILNSGASGTLDLRIRPSSLPSPTGTLSAAAGQTWYFQAWYRDLVGSTTSHMSTSAFVTFR